MYSRNQNQDEPIWGIHINHHDKMASQPCPGWVTGFDKDFWTSIGVVIWDRTASSVFHLSPHQALDVLDALRESSAWKDNPFYLTKLELVFDTFFRGKPKSMENHEKSPQQFRLW